MWEGLEGSGFVGGGAVAVAKEGFGGVVRWGEGLVGGDREGGPDEVAVEVFGRGEGVPVDAAGRGWLGGPGGGGGRRRMDGVRGWVCGGIW